MADTDTQVIPQSAVDVVQPQVVQAALTKQQLADRVGAFNQLQTASGKPQMDADAKAMRDTAKGYMGAIDEAGAKEKQIYDQTRKQMAEKKPVAIPEYHQIPPKDASTFFSMMMVLGALGGRSTMAPMTAAMNNMTGIMKAQNDHNDEMVAAQKEEFKRNFDHAMEVNKQMVEEKKQILENAKWNMAEAEAPLHDWELKYGVDERVAKSSAESFQHQMTAGERLLASPVAKALATPTVPKNIDALAQRYLNGEPLTALTKGWGTAAAATNQMIQQRGAELYKQDHPGSSDRDVGNAISKAALEWKATGGAYNALEKVAMGQEKIGTKLVLDIKNLKDLIPKGDADSVKLLNTPINKLRSAFSSETYAPFRLQAELVGNEFERQMVGNGLSIAQLPVAAQENAHKVMNGDMSVSEMEAIFPTLINDMNNVLTANDQTKKNALSRFDKKEGGEPKKSIHWDELK